MDRTDIDETLDLIFLTQRDDIFRPVDIHIVYKRGDRLGNIDHSSCVDHDDFVPLCVFKQCAEGFLIAYITLVIDDIIMVCT